MQLAQLKDKAYFGAARIWGRAMMAEYAERDGHVQFEATVARVRDLNPVVRRVTLAAPELTGYPLVGPDEYFGLLVPGPDGRLHMPDPDRANVRGAIATMTEDERPGLRWYTIRAMRREQGEIDVDIVTHGDSGPGSAWTSRAKVGDPVGFRSGGALYVAFEPERQLFVADETAVPALLAILEERERRGLPRLGDGATAHVEAPSAEVLQGMDLPEQITVHERGAADPGTAVHQAFIADSEAGGGHDYAWLCGESGLATSLRRHLVREHDMDKKAITFSGYWKLGAARG